MSMEELRAAAAATQPRDVFEVLLPDPPGWSGADSPARNQTMRDALCRLLALRTIYTAGHLPSSQHASMPRS